MSPTAVALLGLVVMLGVMLLRMPVSFAMMLTGFLGAYHLIGPQAALQLLSADIYRQLASYGLAMIPLFILMGQITFRAGISERLYAAAYRWLGALPGGIAATTILASIGFSAVSGSNSATTATVGSVALPELKKYKYDPALSAGSIAIGGTLGVVIPPSTALIIIAVQSEQSVGRLFVAAIVPGVILGATLVVTVLVKCALNPKLGPPAPPVTWRERFAALGGVTETMLLFGIVIGGLYRGWFTPAEAAGAGAFGAIVIAAARRNLTARTLWISIQESLRISAMVVLLITGAVVFARFLTLTRLPFDLAEWVQTLPVPRWVILLIVIAIYLVGGAIMDALGFLVVSIPIFFPLALALGYDPVWFTIVVTLVSTLGAVTPPVGVNIYVVSALDKSIDVMTTFRGVSVFAFAYAAVIALLIIFPGMVT